MNNAFRGVGWSLTVCSVLAAIVFQPLSACAQTTATEFERLLTLDHDVRLDYKVVQSDERTDSMRQADAQSAAQALKSQVDRGVFTKVEADAKLAEYERPQPTSELSVELAVSGDKIFFHKTAPMSGDDEVLVYDGIRTAYMQKTGKSTQLCQVHSGQFGFNGMLGFPIPGIGTPSVPLIDALQSPVVSLTPNGIVKGQSPFFDRGRAPALATLPSEISFSGSGNAIKVQSCSVYAGSPAFLDEKWDFGSFTKSGDQWVARTMTYTEYAPQNDNDPSSVHPSTVLKFTLTNASAEPIDANTFDLTKYVTPGGLAVDLTAGNNVSFSYDPSQSWASQVKRAAFENQRVLYDAHHGRIHGDARTGLFVIASLFCLAGGWMWTRRRSTFSTPSSRGSQV